MARTYEMNAVHRCNSCHVYPVISKGFQRPIFLFHKWLFLPWRSLNVSSSTYESFSSPQLPSVDWHFNSSYTSVVKRRKGPKLELHCQEAPSLKMMAWTGALRSGASQAAWRSSGCVLGLSSFWGWLNFYCVWIFLVIYLDLCNLVTCHRVFTRALYMLVLDSRMREMGRIDFEVTKVGVFTSPASCQCDQVLLEARVLCVLIALTQPNLCNWLYMWSTAGSIHVSPISQPWSVSLTGVTKV